MFSALGAAQHNNATSTGRRLPQRGSVFQLWQTAGEEYRVSERRSTRSQLKWGATYDHDLDSYHSILRSQRRTPASDGRTKVALSTGIACPHSSVRRRRFPDRRLA